MIKETKTKKAKRGRRMRPGVGWVLTAPKGATFRGRLRETITGRGLRVAIFTVTLTRREK